MISFFSVNVLSTSGTPCLMMSVSTLFIGLDVVSCVLICPVTLRIVLCLVDFHFLLSILCVLLILSRFIRATISVFFVLCCPVLLSFYLVLSYMFELNKWRWKFLTTYILVHPTFPLYRTCILRRPLMCRAMHYQQSDNQLGILCFLLLSLGSSGQ